MAYGKDPNVLANVAPYGGSSYAQKVAVATKRPSRSGSSRPHWVDVFTPSEFFPDTVRIIPGAHKQLIADDNGQAVEVELPWVQFVEHYTAVVKRSSICSAGPLRFDKNNRQPCVGCDIFWEDYDIRQIKKANGDQSKGPKRMSMRDMYGFTVLDYATYYKVEQVGGDGQLRTNQQGQPYYEWVKPASPQEIYQYANREQKQGHIMPWTMGKQHFDSLNGYADYIGYSCAGCGNRDCIVPLMWMCPQCGTPAIDFRSTTMGPDQVNQIVTKPHRCTGCGNIVMLEEVVQCQHCQSPRRATIFDVDIQVKRTKSNDPKVRGTILQIVAFSNPQPIQPGFSELAVPIDLLKRFSPTPIQEQQKSYSQLLGHQTTQAQVPAGAPVAAPMMAPQPHMQNAHLIGQQPGMAPPMQQPVMQQPALQVGPPQMPLQAAPQATMVGGFAPPVAAPPQAITQAGFTVPQGVPQGVAQPQMAAPPQVAQAPAPQLPVTAPYPLPTGVASK